MFRPAQSMTIHTVNGIYQAGLAAIRAGQTSIDFSEVTTVDSSAVASLIGWQRVARKQGAALSFVNLPDALHNLATLYDVAGLLQQDAAATPQDQAYQKLPQH